MGGKNQHPYAKTLIWITTFPDFNHKIVSSFRLLYDCVRRMLLISSFICWMLGYWTLWRH